MYDDDDEITDQLNRDNTVYKTVTVDYKYVELKNKITKKIMDLQEQIITAYTDKTSAIASNPNDVLRYSAMVEVLKAMIN